MANQALMGQVAAPPEEMAEWDSAVDRAVAELQGKKREAANLVADAVQFLAASHEDVETAAKQGGLGRVLGFLTGENRKLRERSQRNVLHGQAAVLKLVERLAEQDALQMDAVLALGNLVNYLHFKSVETKQVLVALFRAHENRIRKLEERLDIVEKVHGWALSVPARDYVDLENRSIRLAAYVLDAVNLGVADWHARDIDIFVATLRLVGFERKETITVRGFVGALLEAEETSDWKENVLPMVEPALGHESECGLPCYYALLESVSLQRSEEKYSIVTVATDLAADAGFTLEPRRVKEEVLSRYLVRRGVDLDAEIPVARLGVELLVGARTMAVDALALEAAYEPTGTSHATALPAPPATPKPHWSTRKKVAHCSKCGHQLGLAGLPRWCVNCQKLDE